MSMLEQMIIDADLCIKLGSSEKYHFLLEVLPLIGWIVQGGRLQKLHARSVNLPCGC